MDSKNTTIHLTQTGKQCKKCLDKGGPCHVHSCYKKPKTPLRSSSQVSRRVSRRVSPRVSTRPSSSSPNEDIIAWLQYLPAPALYEVLLRIQPAVLNAACRTNSRAAQICASERFQKDYSKKHKFLPSLFKGDLKYIKDIKHNNTWADEINVLEDDVGNQLHIYRSGNTVDRFFYIPFTQVFPSTLKDFNSIAGSFHRASDPIGITLDKSKHWTMKIGRRYLNPNEMIEFLTTLQRTNWYPGQLGRFKNKNRQREVASQFLNEIRPYVLRVFPTLIF